MSMTNNNTFYSPLFYSFLLFCFLSILSCGDAFAQSAGNYTDIPDIPDFSSELSKDEFLASSNVTEETPYGDKYLAYRIRLSEGWEKSNEGFNSVGKEGGKKKTQVLARRILGEVARYYGPSRFNMRSRIVIQATALDHEITARNWFINYVLSNGYTLKGLKNVSGKRVEGAYVTLEKDQTYFVRVIAEINGPRMVLVSYFLPEKSFMKERAWQQYMTESFEFLKPEKAVTEMTRSYSFLDLLTFDYPTSWRLQAPNVYSIDAMEATIVSSKNEYTLSGEIKISIVSTKLDTDIAQEVGFAKEDLLDTGLTPGGLIGVFDDYTLHDHIFFDRVEVYEAKDPNRKIRDHEYWIAVMVEDRYYYIITMLTPGRDMDFYLWARNTETFKTVIESIRL